MGTHSRRSKEERAANREDGGSTSRKSDADKKKSKKKKAKTGWGTSHWVIVILGVVVALGGLASLVSFFTDDGGVVEIDITDKKLLKEIFYGGEPWVSRSPRDALPPLAAVVACALEVNKTVQGHLMFSWFVFLCPRAVAARWCCATTLAKTPSGASSRRPRASCGTSTSTRVSWTARRPSPRARMRASGSASSALWETPSSF
jgi:hypothetical protein